MGILIACVLSAVLYRAGGMSKVSSSEPKWIPKWLRKSWVRDWLCPPCLYLVLFSFWLPCSLLSWGMSLLSYGLLGGALSTYWDRLFGYDNFYAHGFGCGLAIIPLIVFIPWWIVLIRLVICTVGMGLWSKLINNDVWEEYGRGVLFII